MRILAAFLLMLFCAQAYGQVQLSTKKKKAIDAYIIADNYRVRGQFQQAEKLLLEALDKDDDFYEAWVRLGVTYKMAKKYESAEGAFLKAKEHNPLNKSLSPVFFELGELYLMQGRYEPAVDNLEMYLSSNPRNRTLISEAGKMLESAKYAIENMQAVAEVQLEPLPDQVNVYPMQYFPVLTADKKSLIYTRRLSTFDNVPRNDEDLVIVSRDDNGEWSPPRSLSENINTEENEGTNTISADGRTLIFTSCDGRQTFGSCDLFISYKQGNEWSKPKNMGSTINSSDWDSQPSLSSDGRTLFFVSYRPGGYGKEDIWFSKLDRNGEWSQPVNAGPSINTKYSEISPFFHANGRTLFFSSDGHKGYGGLDIFKSEWAGGQKFTGPENVGPPINTSADQISVFITADGEDGYFSLETYTSDQRESKLYTFKVPDKMKPSVKTNYVRGLVTEKGSTRPLRAEIELIDIQKDQLVNLIYSDSITGEYLIVLPEGSQYALYVNKEGYLFENRSFDYTGSNALDPVRIDFELQPVTKGAGVVLNNIFFDFDSFTIRKESETELAKVVKFMKSNPALSIEISGHTDNKGSSEYNKELSLKRAKAIHDYLVDNGINPERLSYVGCGDEKPLASNDTEENRQRNRRIEFQLI